MFSKNHHKTILTALLIFITTWGFTQHKYEWEHRIRKAQFPDEALQLISEKLQDAKRVKFYKETDSTKVSYEAKFKKDRLHYSIEFDENGVLEDVEILIKPVDIPDDSYTKMTKYLGNSFKKYRIRRMQQHYSVGKEGVEKTLRNAFQNLMLPSIKYELIVAGRKDDGYEQFEILFDAEGNVEKIRKSLPPNYDHVLY
tara:strand:- start:583 stop:1176 length:594 start_codon:yes stop_codon:yes gene_type:complete